MTESFSSENLDKHIKGRSAWWITPQSMNAVMYTLLRGHDAQRTLRRLDMKLSVNGQIQHPITFFFISRGLS